MKMRSMMKMKYLLKPVINYNANRFSTRMEGTYLGTAYFNFTKSKKYRKCKKLLRDYTGLNNQQVKSLLSQHHHLSQISTNHITDCMKICKSFNVDMDSMKNDVKFLNYDREELKNRLLILKEMGANYINTSMIHSMANSVPMVLFKAYACIENNVSAADVMYSTLHKRPPQIPASQKLVENTVVIKYRQECLEHYLRWKFGIDDVEKITTLSTKLLHRPLSNIEFCFDVLHNYGKMPMKTILEHHCLVNCSANNLKMILQYIQTICGVTIVELLSISPALHRMKYKDVKCIKTHLETHNITSEQIKICPKVLLTEKQDFLKGWRILMQEPKLQMLLKSPNVLRIFTFPKDIPIRLKYLDYLNISSITPNIFFAHTGNFERLVKTGVFRNQIDEASLILANEFKLDPVCVKKILRAHPRVRHMNLYNMHTTLSYLQTKFTNSDIRQCLHVILYPKYKVEKVLEKYIHDSASMDASDHYTVPQLLTLCVYEIEKKFHFTGDGIWDEMQEKKLPKLFEEHSNNKE